MTACATVVAWLPLFVGDDLDTAHAAVVRTHLRSCADCRKQASALQAPLKALRGLAAAPVAGVDEAMFADLHERIVAAVEAEAGTATVPGGRRWSLRNWSLRNWSSQRWPLSAAAAAVLFVGGWAFVRALEPASLLDRPPLGTPAAHSGELTVVPWSGERVPLQPLGHQVGPADAGSDLGGAGMMVRWRLRTLEDIDLQLPEAVPVRR